MDGLPTPAGTDVVDRLVAATDAHDLEALVGCFADDYVLTDPVHPARGFTGSGQVRRNWSRILDGVPDLRCRALGRADAPPRAPGEPRTVWLELEMTGTRRDGTAHELAGVMVFGVAGERIVTGRFFLAPVDHDPTDVGAAVRAAMEGGRP